jgi:putative nucleotidyltransferase with HDIG domain
MKLQPTFLHSKIARRIFWLFVLCALIPITVLALVSLRNVSGQLKEESHRRLHQAAREEAMIICAKLMSLDGDLKLIALGTRAQSAESRPSSVSGTLALSNDLGNRIKGLDLLMADRSRRHVFGETRAAFDFSADEQAFLRSDKSVLSTFLCEGGAMCIYLSRQLDADRPEKGILVAQINPSYLWDAENLSAELGTCVFDLAGQTLFCSARSPGSFPPQAAHSFSGGFEWQKDQQEFVADYWNLPLQAAFFVPHWTIVSSRAKSQVLAPLVEFKTGFIFVYLLAIWVVVLLSLIQIRRNLVPLGKLKEGTGQLSRGDFHTRVNVRSGDEFEELASSFNFMADRIEKQLNSLKVFNEIDRAILSAWDIGKIVDRLSTRLGELIPLNQVAVALFEAQGSLKWLTYIYDSAPRARKTEEFVEVSADETRALLQQPHHLVQAGSTELASYLKPLHARGMRHFLVVPVSTEGRLSAILMLSHATSCPWTEEDKEHARKLGDQFAVALANSQLVNQLHQLQWGTLTALARAIDAKSPWTLGHSERVTKHAVDIATVMGLAPKELDIIRRGCLLHDVGKIGTPVSILDKVGKLTAEETKIMQEHVTIGGRILEPIPGLAESMPIVLQHHEWLNGRGYPFGLAGEEIQLNSRIAAVADVFDALVSDRPYRKGMQVDRAMQIIREGVGTQFDPRVVEVFERITTGEIAGIEKEEIDRLAITVV